MNGLMRNYVLATLVPVLAMVSITLLVSDDVLDSILAILSVCVCFPIVMMGLYMYLEGSGHRWINGVDWNSMSPSEIRNGVSYWGLFMTVGSMILLVSLNIIISHMFVSIALIVVSIIVMLFPVTRIYAGNKVVAMKERSRNAKVGIYAVVLAVTLLALFGLGFNSEDSQTVNINLGDEDISVKAPMFDKTFEYSEIEEMDYDLHFDKGSRVSGYNTGFVSSGKFKNDVFGRYQLASYTKVDPCVWIKVDGNYYAFNQSTEDETYDLYLQLKAKTGL